MYLLGINAYHPDSSACLVKDGNLISAVEEERFRRVKHWAGFPSQSIRNCLDQAGIVLSDIDHIAVNSDPKANFIKKIGFSLSNKPNPGLLLERIRNMRQRQSIVEKLESCFVGQSFKGKAHYIEHHRSHLGSSFLVSPFDKAVAVSIDGFGDFSSAAWGVGHGNSIKIDNRVYFPHSLGIFYQALTQFIGFPNYGDEYKVMGLAPYGKPSYMDEMRQIVQLKGDGSFRLNMDYFIYHKEKTSYEWEGGSPYVGRLFSDQLVQLLGPVRDAGQLLEQRHKDIARSVQGMYEEAFFHLLNRLYEQYRLDSVCLSGGCAMNSVANGKIRRETEFKHVYIQSAAGDAGGAIGAAFAVWSEIAQRQVKNQRSCVMDHSYFGPSFDNEYIGKILDARRKELDAEGCMIQTILDEQVLCNRTADLVSEGKVIGWFQGRMEWGPRALGNRSILGDPRRSDMKDILNLKIKRRESFRPFAPSILREKVSEWFEEDGDVPFMMQVYQIREEKRNEIPAVTHTDGSGRLQTVHENSNPRYYQLIKSFNEITGVPILLNTSFNENEPVVCLPEEALDCFLRTNMDVLVIGDWFVERLSK